VKVDEIESDSLKKDEFLSTGDIIASYQLPYLSHTSKKTHPPSPHTNLGPHPLKHSLQQHAPSSPNTLPPFFKHRDWNQFNFPSAVVVTKIDVSARTTFSKNKNERCFVQLLTHCYTPPISLEQCFSTFYDVSSG
jgi:hypothetical protein